MKVARMACSEPHTFRQMLHMRRYSNQLKHAFGVVFTVGLFTWCVGVQRKNRHENGCTLFVQRRAFKAG